jgi:hypothetical protein
VDRQTITQKELTWQCCNNKPSGLSISEQSGAFNQQSAVSNYNAG